jgi:hypothetical protein
MKAVQLRAVTVCTNLATDLSTEVCSVQISLFAGHLAADFCQLKSELAVFGRFRFQCEHGFLPKMVITAL